MNTEQALQVLKQAIDLAVGAGSFKSAQDVSTIAMAMETVLKEFQGSAELVNKEPQSKKK